METGPELRLEASGGGWQIAGAGSAAVMTVNVYLGYLADRNYSPATVRAYGFDLLAFCRWLASEGLGLGVVNTDVLLRYLTACRHASVPGRPGPHVLPLQGRRPDAPAPPTASRPASHLAERLSTKRRRVLRRQLWLCRRGPRPQPRRLPRDAESPQASDSRRRRAAWPGSRAATSPAS